MEYNHMKTVEVDFLMLLYQHKLRQKKRKKKKRLFINLELSPLSFLIPLTPNLSLNF